MQDGSSRLDTFHNEWYHPGRGKIVLLLWYFVNVIFFINPLNPISSLKVKLLRLFGATIGKGVVIKPGVSIKYPWRLFIGNYVWIGEKVWIDNLADIHIENHVCVSQGSMLLTGNHNYKLPTFDLMLGEITLKTGSWVGAQCLVCPGVTLASHAVLGAGAVANKSIPEYEIWAGVPATFARQREISI